MNTKLLQRLISAGIFSTALLAGAAYAKEKGSASSTPTSEIAKDAPPPAPATEIDDAPAKKTDAKNTTSKKSTADNGCGGAGGCGADSGENSSEK